MCLFCAKGCVGVVDQTSPQRLRRPATKAEGRPCGRPSALVEELHAVVGDGVDDLDAQGLAVGQLVFDLFTHTFAVDARTQR